MLKNFRTELEELKKVKDNPYEFEAERFLEYLLIALKDLDVSQLMRIETLNVTHRLVNGEHHISVAYNEESPFLVKKYSSKIATKLFETIKEVVSRSYWISDKVCSFSFKI